ncbi:MAG: hypothetical protein WC887_00450 [Candidatus Paceibacterota bacterium]|jgi:excinuclease ABC subunit C
MRKIDLQKYNLPDVPGVYLFKQGRKVLYVGKATSLRDRVRSYFDDELIVTRGPRVVDMITKADRVAHEPTPTVLEALVREAALIKKYHPSANSEGKDDKTFLYAVITQEDIPRVLVVRGKDLMQGQGVSSKGQEKRILKPCSLNLTPDGTKIRAVYGPFPSGAQLKEGLRLIRRIFPFFDTPKPLDFARGKPTGKHQRTLIEFNTQIKQYPREFDAKEYRRTIRHIMLFLSGRAKALRKVLAQDMKRFAGQERFEDAAEARRELFALDHIQDVSLIKDENLSLWKSDIHSSRGCPTSTGRIEAYDTAHLSGTDAIGVMTVIVDGAPIKKEYRTFRIRGFKKNDDIASLKEILSRRLNHPEWPFPNAIVVDGGKVQKKAAETVLAEAGMQIPVVAVVKDERHRPREVIGARATGISEADAVLANAEAHRFSLSRHRRARSQKLRSK